MKRFTTILIAFTLAACTAKAPDMPTTGELKQYTANAAQPAPARFRVQMVASFVDKLAYGDVRGVYVITDTTTGQEFVGISGIGISELGSHQSGKVRVGDER